MNDPLLEIKSLRSDIDQIKKNITGSGTISLNAASLVVDITTSITDLLKKIDLISDRVSVFEKSGFLSWFNLENSKLGKINSDGGYMYKLINKTGAATIKGYVVCPHTSVDKAVRLVVDGTPNPIGVFYESGVADGDLAWVVSKGPAQVYFTSAATIGHIARTFISSEAGYVSGEALSEAMPTSPFASDKHFCELGHVLQTTTGAGLAWTDLHQN